MDARSPAPAPHPQEPLRHKDPGVSPGQRHLPQPTSAHPETVGEYDHNRCRPSIDWGRFRCNQAQIEIYEAHFFQIGNLRHSFTPTTMYNSCCLFSLIGNDYCHNSISLAATYYKGFHFCSKQLILNGKWLY